MSFLFLTTVWDGLGLTPVQALTVVAASVVVYLAAATALRLAGSLLLREGSTVDRPILLIVGAALGRGALGYTPTATASVIAFVTLLVVHAAARRLARTRLGARVLLAAPAVLIADGRIDQRVLDRSRLTSAGLAARLRAGGVQDVRDVACGVLEPSGTVTVFLAAHGGIDPAVLAGVHGVDALPASVLRRP